MNQNSQPDKFLKFLQFPLVRILLGFLTLVIAATLLQVGTELWPGHKTDITNLVSVLITALGVLLTYYGFVHFIERRPVTEPDVSSAGNELIAGALIGALLFSVTIGFLWIFGFYHVTGVNNWTAIFPWLVLAIFSGVFEELLIRGILFRIMEESLGSWLALAISAIIFGFLHLANPNATLWGAVAIAIEAGIMLAAAFMYTRRLWLPIGIHFAWNFTQGAIFGVAVSGNEAKGLLQSTLTGPELLSGGAFGAEASIFAVVVCFAAGIFFVWKSLKQERFIKPFWRRLA
ncbi:MAG: CPBP family intramembrane metalloprotease [Chloroflexi bacterium]|nr:CPBP family intramembrane metalloprotease [Chloroflexota bacterium]